MSAGEALLDTDTLSAIMRGDGVANTHSRTYLAQFGQFQMSVITRYEVLRGLYARNADARVAAFNELCDRSTVLPFTDSIAQRAAEIYGSLYRGGTLIGDADILIAATALDFDLVLITNNVDHFGRVAGLRVGNWIR